MVRELKNKVMAGGSALREELLVLVSADLEELCQAAEELRNHFCGKEFHLCTILNAKSGGCTENCKYCAQSLHYRTRVDSYPMKAESEILWKMPDGVPSAFRW
jgi:biotin synthase